MILDEDRYNRRVSDGPEVIETVLDEAIYNQRVLDGSEVIKKYFWRDRI